jgi:glycosyltransferase involved in cell wall biosynthesis
MITWHSSFASLTGYSGASRAFVSGLDAAGVAVRPLYLFNNDAHEEQESGPLPSRLRELQHLPLRLDTPQVVFGRGDLFSKNSGRPRIGYTMLETDRLPAAWVEQANQMDEVWTPTAWGAEVFRASGITRPVVIVPLGVDLATFAPAPPRTRLVERTIFVSVFEWGRRKGVDLLLKAYRAAFKPDDAVLLILKIDNRAPASNPFQELAAWLPSPAPPVGIMYNQRLSPQRMAELYQGADCFVLPTRGEGWCMPALEAMACGLPAIVTAWSGPTAFLTTQNGYPLPITGLEPTSSSNPYYRDAQWATPDMDALVELLRTVHARRDDARRCGAQAAIDARAWGWERAVQVVIKRLDLRPGDTVSR